MKLVVYLLLLGVLASTLALPANPGKAGVLNVAVTNPHSLEKTHDKYQAALLLLDIEPSPRKPVQSDKKRYFLGTNMVNFEVANKFCSDTYGGTLVNLDEDEDIDYVRQLTIGEGGVNSRLWVGGRVTCGRPEDFNLRCWEWVNGRPIETPWTQEVIDDGFQTSTSRTLLHIADGLLDIAENTALEQFVCERLKNPPPCAQ